MTTALPDFFRGSAIHSGFRHSVRSWEWTGGGKDRHPFPVPLKTYDESLNVLRTALDAAKVDDKEKLEGFRRLNRFVQTVEKKFDPKADLTALIAHEEAISPSLDGRSVFDDEATRTFYIPRQGSPF